MDQKFNLSARKTDAMTATKCLQKWSKLYGTAISRLGDIYAVHLLLADYEVRIRKDTPAASMTREEFLKYVVLTEFETYAGRHIGQSSIPNGSTIGVHHSTLQMHCLIQILPSGKRSVFYHKGPLNDPDHFVIGNLVPDRDTYHEGFCLLDRPGDKAVLNQALGKMKYDLAAGVTYVPSEYPQTRQETEPVQQEQRRKPWSSKNWARGI